MVIGRLRDNDVFDILPLKGGLQMRRIILLFTFMLITSLLIFGCATTTATTTTTTTTTGATTSTTSGSGSVSPPSSTVKLIFIHHSTGENWLNDSDGGLGIALRDNNYFVSDTNYGWGPSVIGDNTDIGWWYEWFRGTSSSTYLAALYAESDQNCTYSRLSSDPGGSNTIVMFKSCFPNSNISGSPSDAAATGATNPIAGENYDEGHHTMANVKWVYNQLLTYFATRTDVLFVAVTAPPLSSGNYTGSNAANARAFNNWLVNDWLSGYAHSNVAVFDFYNVLTDPNNHHRWQDGAVQHTTASGSSNGAYYPTASDGSDDHPNSTGNQKATTEFVPLLNYWHNRWQGLL